MDTVFDKQPALKAEDSCESVLNMQSHKPAHPHTHGDEFHHHHRHADGTVHAFGHHLLQVENLSVAFTMYESASAGMRGYLGAERRKVRAIDNLSVSVHAGEVLAVVGASGAGKTLLADSILGIYQPNATVEGEIWFDGERQDASSLAQLRRSRIAYIPQSVNALDPLMKVGRQVRGIAEGRADKERRKARQKELFAEYGLSQDVAGMYPHELSGGMARRVLLCAALMEEPDLIIADEPTPGMDAQLAVQALIALREFADAGNGVMLITHDINLALGMADRVAIFNQGTVVEETSASAFRQRRLESDFACALWDAMPENGFYAEGEGSDA